MIPVLAFMRLLSQVDFNIILGLPSRLFPSRNVIRMCRPPPPMCARYEAAVRLNASPKSELNYFGKTCFIYFKALLYYGELCQPLSRRLLSRMLIEVDFNLTELIF